MHRIVMQRVSWIAIAIVLFPALGAVAADSPDELEPIIVVGQKENESLQKAPEAITAISSQQLRENFIRAPEDLNSQVPSLVIGMTDGYNNVVAIRGIGLNSPQDDGSPASVSFHQNGIFIPDPISLATNFLDVDHIEVLRGPQGTVFGQNSVGGTVNVITVQPKLDEFSGYTRLEFGSFDLEHATAAVNLPVSSTFALRLAGDFIQQQGYATATEVPGTDFQLDNTHNYHLRISALFQPIDAFSLFGTLEYAKTDQHEIESKNILDPNRDPYDETSDWPGLFLYDQTLAGLTATYNFDNNMVLKSLSGLEYTNQTGSNSESGLTIALATPIYGGENVQYWLHDIYSVTQEFDLSGKNGPVDWVLGAFYLHSRTTDGYDQYLRNAQEPGSPNILNDEQESLVAPEIAAGTLYFETSNAFRRELGFRLRAGCLPHHGCAARHARAFATRKTGIPPSSTIISVIRASAAASLTCTSRPASSPGRRVSTIKSLPRISSTAASPPASSRAAVTRERRPPWCRRTISPKPSLRSSWARRTPPSTTG